MTRLFSLKNNKRTFRMSSVTILLNALRVKACRILIVKVSTAHGDKRVGCFPKHDQYYCAREKEIVIKAEDFLRSIWQ